MTAIRIRCQTDLQLFTSFFFPEHCRLNFNKLHEYLIARRLEKIRLPPTERRGELDVVLAPRGAAKSTLVSLAFPLHALLYGLEGYIILISATLRQAAQRLANLRVALLTNPSLKKYFAPELATLGSVTARALELNGARIEAFSAGTELRGISHGPWRPTWIILDDAERSDRARRAAHREALAEWFSEVIENLGAGYTHIDVVGTLLHRDALPARLMKRPDVSGQTFSAILSEARQTGLWEAWRERYHDLTDPDRVRHARAFFNGQRAAMLDGASVLWPEKEDYYDLQVMRETRGHAAFDKEKQNAPWADGSALFAGLRLRRFRLVEAAGAPARLVREPGWSSLWGDPGGAAGGATRTDEMAKITGTDAGADGRPELTLEDLRVFGFLDPALGRRGAAGRAEGDFAAIATVGIDGDGYLYLLDVWLARAAPSEQVQQAFDLHARWHYQGFGVETNAFQRLLLDPLETERARRRAAGRPWDLPIIERRHRGDKQSRILTLEPLLRNGWLLLGEGLDEEFMNQLRDFPNAAHDDGPDAAAAAIALARASQATLAPRTDHLPRRTKSAMRSY